MNRLLALQVKQPDLVGSFQQGRQHKQRNRLMGAQLENTELQNEALRGEPERRQQAIKRKAEINLVGHLVEALGQTDNLEEKAQLYTQALEVGDRMKLDMADLPREFKPEFEQMLRVQSGAKDFKFKEPKAVTPTKIEKLQNYHDRLPEGDPRRANVLAAIQKESGGGEPKPQGFTLSEGQQRFDDQGNVVATGTSQNTSGAANPSKSDIKIDEESRKQAVKVNAKRIGELNNSKASRSASVRKARRFLRAFKSKDNDMLEGKAESGVTRSALNAKWIGTDASIFPGVFTDQGQFDEELNAFAEIAAREKLKAVGEIRPTDPDVEGMKRAMFGVGRDEETNINLLEEFINDQQAIDDELDDLLELQKAGRLDTFIDFSSGRPQVDLPEGVTEEDIQHTMQVHGVSREAVLQRLQQ